MLHIDYEGFLSLPVNSTWWAMAFLNLLLSLLSEGLKSFLLALLFQLLIQQLRDRLFHAQGESVGDQQPPPFPYTRVHIGAVPSPAAKSSSVPQGPVHKPGPRHPEKVSPRLK